MLRTKKILSALMLTFCSASLSLLLVNCNGSGFELADTCFNDGGDPLFSYAWHLANCGQAGVSRTGGTSGMDLNLRATWSAGILGNGVKVRVSDDGLENTHEDLKGNFQTVALRSRDYTLPGYSFVNAPPNDCPNADPDLSEFDDHGTAVAGLIAAVGGNGVGSRGVAPKAQLNVANLLSCAVTQTTAMVLDQATGTDFDILNMSWGVNQNKKPIVVSTYEDQLKHAVTNYRDSNGLKKGAILVKAAGNFFTTNCSNDSSRPCIGNSNFDGDNTNPYQIVVGALSAKGVSATYSSPGANLWISAFGGEFGYANPAMVTTDRTGCSDGYSYSGASNTIPFENGSSPNTNCNYTATFNGTSSAAPLVSGVAALLLEVNPNLTWRDMKYILAKTADPVDYVTTGSIPHPYANHSMYPVSIPTGYVWELPWRTNGAGFKFQNWYGFGKVNVDAAVAMAKNYTSTLGAYHESAWSDFPENLVVPANSATGVTSSVTISAADSNVKIESVQIRLEVTSADISTLAIELTSPSGMRSIVVNMHNSLRGLANYTNQVFLTNAFYQERSTGLWTLKVISGGSSATITSWGIRFTGVK